MNISVFGIGYVGCVSLGCLAADGHNVIGVDTNETKLEIINSGKATVVEKDLEPLILEGVEEKKIIATDNFKHAVENSEISVICVGTPLSDKGNLDLSHILKVSEQIGTALKNKKDFHIVSVRSSIPPGTITEIEKIISKVSGKKADLDFSVLANPEFLREGSAVYDYYNPSYTVIGGVSIKAMEKLASIYKKVKAEIIFTDIKNAELIKFASNSFHALKVSFANEIGNICSALNMDSLNFMNIFIKDKKLNVSSNYLQPGFAYGGSCLPKDLNALENLAKNLSVKTPLLNKISQSNEIHIEKAYHLIEKTKKKNIGFIGLTFKEGTDDVRNSPCVRLVKKVLNKKLNVKIFDSNLNLDYIIGANKEYLFNELPIISDYLVNSLKNLISESDVIVIASSELISTKEVMKLKDKVIIDLVRIDKRMRTKDNYVGLSW